MNFLKITSAIVVFFLYYVIVFTNYAILFAITSSPTTLNNKLLVVDTNEAFLDNKNDEILTDKRVTIRSDKFFIIADKALYNKKDTLLIAKGHVSVHDRRYNNFYYVDYARINQKNDGIELFSFKSKLMNDKILATASKVSGKSKKEYSIKNLTFTTCKLCADNWVKNTPIWQIRASNVDINIAKDSIYYHDVLIDFWGRPILYLPYLSTPSFNSRFRTGFLFPGMYMGHQNYGLTLTTPYYVNFTPSTDLTITPYFSTTKPMILSLENRRVFKNGGYILTGSITSIATDYRKGQSIYRGYVAGSGNWNLLKKFKHEKNLHNDNKSSDSFDPWDPNIAELGFDTLVLFDKDKTYLKRYDYNNDDILLSKIYLNKANDLSFLSLSIDGVQDLRNNDYNKKIIRSLSEKIISLPRLRFLDRIPIFTQQSDNYDHFIKFDGDLYELHSEQGINYTKIDFNIGWCVPVILRGGNFFEFKPLINAFGYDQNKDSTYNLSEKTRSINIIPEFVSTWRIPWLFLSNTSLNNVEKREKPIVLRSIFVEPAVNLRLAPTSRIYQPEFDQKFLLPSAYDIINSNRRSSLLDQLHSGNSLQYGIKASMFFSSHNQIDLILAKSQRFYTSQPEEKYSEKYSGVSIYRNNRGSSDLIFFSAFRSSIWSIESNIWYNEKDKSIVRSTIDLDCWLKKIQTKIGYTFTDYRYYNIEDLNYKQEIFLDLWYNFYQRWWLNLNARKKLGKEDESVKNKTPSAIRQGIGIRYKNECLQVDFSIYKNYLRINDIKPSTSYSMRLGIPF